MYQCSFIPLAAVVCGIMLSGPAWADGQDDNQPSQAEVAAAQQPAPADPTGSWHWEYTPPDGPTFHFSLRLANDGGKVTGKYTAFDHTIEIEDAKLEGDALSFRVRDEFDGNPLSVDFHGKVEPDDIVGKVAVDMGDGAREFDWHAKREVDADDVVGTWQLHLEVPNRDPIEPRITITKNDKGLHGEYVSPFGEREAKNVKLEKNELSWEVSGERDDFSFKVVYHGKPRGNAIAGKTEYDFNGNTGTMEFTGKRLPDKEGKSPAAAAHEPEDTSGAAGSSDKPE